MFRPVDLRLSEIEHLILGSNLHIYDVDTREGWTLFADEDKGCEEIPEHLLNKYVVIIMPEIWGETGEEYLSIGVVE